MTIEGAVRALAGSMVLASVALGYWVHPGFFILTAFVGANLLQSAFTGICPPSGLFPRMGLRESAGSHDVNAGGAVAQSSPRGG